jgi:Kef-type K+ transport system membrane component KefB
MDWWSPIVFVVLLLLLALLLAGVVLAIRFGWYAQALLVIALLTTAISSIVGIVMLLDSNLVNRAPGAILLAAGVTSLSVSVVAAAMMSKRADQ